MQEISNAQKDKFEDIKNKIKEAHDYFEDNYKRYVDFRNFTYKSTLSGNEISALNQLGKPALEFNIQNAYLSRQVGEFSKQMPSPVVRAAEDADKVDPITVELVEAHLRAKLNNQQNDYLRYEVYSQMMSGGFSAMKVYTDYAHDKTFRQEIFINRVFDPSLCGWDPSAVDSHKGDGNFCFEMFPLKKKDFEREYGKIDKNISYSGNFDAFHWYYRTGTEEFILVCDFYVKEKKKAKLVKLSDGQEMLEKDYEDFLVNWEEQRRFEQPPQISEQRMTMVESIVRYKLTEDKILEKTQTSYRFLPIVFFAGISILLKDGINGSSYELTRPYLYDAKDIQRLKNFSGQSLANELENITQWKMLSPVESIPVEYMESWTNPQSSQVLLYNSFLKDNPDKTLPPPQVMPRQPIPPEITNTFDLADKTTQAILGSYDAALGINNNQLSGVAIVEGATQSNAAAMPFVVGFMRGLTQVCKIIVDLIPKYYVTPRTIPIMTTDGKKEFLKVNEQGTPQLDYSENALNVNVEAGVNFTIQKNRALDQLISLSKANQTFNALLEEEGLPMLIDNLDMRGIDSLKSKVEPFLQSRAQKMQQSQQMQQKMMMDQSQMAQQKLQNESQKTQADVQDKAVKNQLKQQELQQKAQKDSIDARINIASIGIKEEAADTERMQALAKVGETVDSMRLREMEVEAENTRSLVNLLTNQMKDIQEMQHKHIRLTKELGEAREKSSLQSQENSSGEMSQQPENNVSLQSNEQEEQ